MASVNTNDLRITNAENLVSSLSDISNTGLSHLFIGKANSWSTGDESPPVPSSNVSEFFQTYDQMIALQRIDNDEIFHMIPKVQWVSGIIFDMYRNDYSKSNTSTTGKNNIFDARWITINQNNNVYICLDNNKGGVSTIEPINTGDEAFYTSDGYQWLKVYTMTSAALKVATTNLIPIVQNEVVDTTDGEIYTVVIENSGTNYTSSPAGVVNSIPQYYCKINGDGTGAAARVVVENGSITEVKVVRSGSGYTYGFLDFTVNKVYQSLSDMDTETSGLNPLGSGDFRSTVIIGPPGGWGSDLVRELGGTRVGIFSNILSNTTDFLNNTSFRQIGVLKGAQPQAGQNNPTTMNATYAVKIVTQNASAPIYREGEIISQTVIVNGEPKVAKGVVVSWSGNDEVNGILNYVQDPRIATDDDGALYRFTGNRPVIGETTGKIGTVVDYDGVESDRTFVNGYSTPEIQHYSGKMVYLSNISPVIRSTTQNESISLIISF